MLVITSNYVSSSYAVNPTLDVGKSDFENLMKQFIKGICRPPFFICLRTIETSKLFSNVCYLDNNLDEILPPRKWEATKFFTKYQPYFSTVYLPIQQPMSLEWSSVVCPTLHKNIP